MKYFRITYKDGKFLIVKAKTYLEVIKKFDLTSRSNVDTHIRELSGEQRAIAIDLLKK